MVSTLPSSVSQACDSADLESKLQELQEVFQYWDVEASRRARFRRRFGIVIALAGPLAVLPLAVQIAGFPEPGAVAFALIGLELVTLSILLVILFADLVPSQDAWMRDRVRAEVLRRERYLILSRVGPYLARADLCLVIQERIDFIANRMTYPEEIILLEDHNGTAWRSALEEAGAGATAPPDARCIEEFARERISYQQRWYSEKSHIQEQLFHGIEAAVRVALVAAAILSAIHLTNLSYGQHSKWVDAFALSLPAIGAAGTALHMFLESRRLARTYQSHARRLQRLDTELDALRARQPLSPADQHRFKRLVLQTEELLAEELLQWWLHAYR
jgi:hypothetical protein